MSAGKHARPLLALRALRRLVCEPHTLDELAAALDVSKSAVVRLLAALRADGVVIERLVGARPERIVRFQVTHRAALVAVGLDPKQHAT